MDERRVLQHKENNMKKWAMEFRAKVHVGKERADNEKTVWLKGGEYPEKTMM